MSVSRGRRAAAAPVEARLGELAAELGRRPGSAPDPAYRSDLRDRLTRGGATAGEATERLLTTRDRTGYPAAAAQPPVTCATPSGEDPA